MSRVLLYDAPTSRVSVVSMPPGEFLPHLRSKEGDLMWRFMEPDGSASVIYGSLVVPDNAVCVLIKTPYTTDEEARKLERPPNEVLLEAMFQNSKDANMLGTVQQKADTLENDLKKARQTHKTHLASSKRKASELEAATKAAKQEAQESARKASELQTEHNELAANYETLRANKGASASSSSGKSSLLDCEQLYIQLMNKVKTDLIAAVPPPAPPSTTAAATTPAAPTQRHEIALQFEDDSGNWQTCTTPAFVSAFGDLFEKLFTATTFTMGQYTYDAALDAATTPVAPAIAHFFQTNQATSKQRKVRAVPLATLAPTATSSSGAADSVKLEAIAGPNFPTHLSKYEAQRYLGAYALDGVARTSKSTEFKGLLAELGNIFSDYCQYHTKYTYDPKKCEPLIKPCQLFQALHLIATKGIKYARLVVHGTKTSGYKAVSQDLIGLDLTYCRTSCRYGKANYVALTHDAPEGQGYNGGTRGQCVLLLLLSPHARLDTSEPAAFTSYQFCCSHRLNGNQVQDAVAVFSNNYLLPLGIISP